MSPYSVAALSVRFALRPFGRGGDEGIRTLDPLRARQVLSQLSYTPVFLRALRAFLFSASESTFAPSKLNNVT